MNRAVAKIQGVGTDTFNFNEAIEYACGISGQVVTINPEMIICAKKNPKFAKIINNAELVIPDGIGVEIGLRILGHKVKRIPGIEFADKMVSLCETVALVGAKPDILAKTVENLKTKGVNIVYAKDGYFSDDSGVYAELQSIQPRLLLVAMGSPRQEEFIYGLKEILPNTLMIGVGGSFDVWSGEVKRAPVFFQKLGIEWLYRTLKEPARFKRIFPTLPLFLINVIKEKYVNR